MSIIVADKAQSTETTIASSFAVLSNQLQGSFVTLLPSNYTRVANDNGGDDDGHIGENLSRTAKPAQHKHVMAWHAL